MPKRPEDYMADRRERILDAVDRCCWEKGWNQTTLRDVAKAAGLSKGGVYVHFPTKTELLRGMLQRNLEHLDKLGTAPDPQTFVQWRLDSLDFLAGPGGRERAISLGELQMDGLRAPELRPLVEEVTRHAVDVLEAMVRRLCPRLGQEEARDRALSILCLLEGLRNYAAVAESISLEQFRRIVTRELTALLDCNGD
ncbi:TetR/AcrR family transcriptional regulator [Sphingomonas colocasiae]|uniref:TetR/AcrR family transcriptional regulator n=1 Tax=Sphingomonas colocasiae TaxID=1848973 RepID=A0ABS7PYF9_9SPHN|nr:TetR/AcrR family transcriptional regulator [Sphingomonas colocasiae]MBY8826402.1 TetR/AcrR family transcriptional regulator [Sphingomonas colocasiae]